MKTEAEAIESFRAALYDLTFNSKPIITGLTVKAQEMIPYAPSLVQAPQPLKLPCLYLIDSIVKNLGDPFVDLFAEHLSDSFCTVYTSLTDERARKEFLRVYGLWHGVFPALPLKDIGERLRLGRSQRNIVRPQPQIPPPLAPKSSQPTPPSFHYPPRPPSHMYQQEYSSFNFPSNTQPPRMSPSVTGMLVQLRTILMAPPHVIPPNVIPDIIYRLGALGELDHLLLRDLDSRCRLPDPRPALDLLGHILEHSTPQPYSAPTKPSLPSPPTAPAQKEESRPLHFALYSARSKQCKKCGIRFSDDQSGKDAYAIHLDAHFRRNMRLRDRTKKVLARDWLQPAAEWAAGKAPGVTEKPVPVFFDSVPSTGKVASKQELREEIPMIKAGESERDRKCPMCNEPLDIIFDNDQDEWMFTGVVERDGEIFHVSCIDDDAQVRPSAKKSRSE